MNIYISGLSYGINDADLNELFSAYGETSSAKVIMDRESGRSRGFGFVEMTSDTDGQKAINELNGAEYDQKTISIILENFCLCLIQRTLGELPNFGVMIWQLYYMLRSALICFQVTRFRNKGNHFI